MKINRKIFKIFILMLILLIVGLVISNNAFAWVDRLLANYEDIDATKSENTITHIMGAVINLASTVAAGIAIIMLIVLGVQYVSKGAEGKADAKKDLTGYIVGVVILFGVSGILRLAQMFIDSNLNDITKS